MVSSFKVRKTIKRNGRKLELSIVPKPVELHPYRCACSQVKAGAAQQCPVHFLSSILPYGRH